MKTIMLHNPRCSKCRTALDQLNENGCEIELVEYLKDTPTVKELKAIIKKIGIKPEELLRRTEPLFKEQFAGKKHTGEEWIRIMVKHPVLIQRPVIIRGDVAVIGRDEESIEKILKS